MTRPAWVERVLGSPIRREPSAWLIGLLLVLSVWAVYGQTLGFGFVNYDDPVYVGADSPVRQGLTWDALRWAFTTSYGANWFPLLWLSLMLDVEIAGPDPRMFHLTNLLLHAANTLLLFHVLDRATRARWKSAWVAALFALHPLHVESVAWITARKDVLSTLFWFLTMWLWLRWVERPGALRYAAVIVSFVLGLLSKSMLVTLPFALLLFDFWPLGRHRGYPIFSLVREKLPLLGLAAASSAVTIVAQRAGEAVGTVEFHPLTARLVNALVSYATYLEKTFWPTGLAVLYPHPGSHQPLGPVLGAVLVLAVVTAAVAVLGRARPYLTVGWLWYLGTLLPVIGIIQIFWHARADRYTYVPLVGVFIMLAWGVPDLLPRRRRLVGAGALASLAAAAWIGHLQCGYWQDSIRLFERTVEVTTENAIARNNLALAYYERNQPGDLERAVSHFTEAVRIDPSYVTALSSLAGVLLKLGRTEEAIDRWSEVVRRAPRYTMARCNLCGALSRVGRLAEAEQRCLEALRLSPPPACAHYLLGHLYLQQSRIPEAERHLLAAVRLAPLDAEIRSSLGVVLAKQGKVDQAITQYEEALRLDPSNQVARANLDRIRRRTGTD